MLFKTSKFAVQNEGKDFDLIIFSNVIFLYDYMVLWESVKEIFDSSKPYYKGMGFNTMSKIEANRLEIELVETDLFATIAEIESLLGKQIRDKGLKFKVDYQFPLPDWIVSDPTRLRQILLNTV